MRPVVHQACREHPLRLPQLPARERRLLADQGARVSELTQGPRKLLWKVVNIEMSVISFVAATFTLDVDIALLIFI